MTPYTYQCPTTELEFEENATFGAAPRSVPCVWHQHEALRVFSGAIQFTYGKEDFHGPTIGERFDRQIADCVADGKGYEPVGQRWI